LKGSSKRVIKIPWSSFLALSPRACLPVVHGRRLRKPRITGVR
jgi:hypothetical protein